MICPYCNKPAEWVENKAVYGRNYGDSYMIWLCRTCDARVGCHLNTKVPLGTMANKQLREIRIKAHDAIDPFWKSGHLRRKEVYARLKEVFGFEVHIGESDEAMCNEIMSERVLRVLKRRRKKVHTHQRGRGGIFSK